MWSRGLDQSTRETSRTGTSNISKCEHVERDWERFQGCRNWVNDLFSVNLKNYQALGLPMTQIEGSKLTRASQATAKICASVYAASTTTHVSTILLFLKTYFQSISRLHWLCTSMLSLSTSSNITLFNLMRRLQSSHNNRNKEIWISL